MMLGTNTDIKVTLFLDGNKIEKCQEVVLVGRTIEYIWYLIFNVCRTVNYKLHALQR